MIKKGSLLTISMQEKVSDTCFRPKICNRLKMGSTDPNFLLHFNLSCTFFKGTHVEGRISLSQAEELMERGEIDKALHLLRVVQPSQNHFVESRKLMAHIYLNFRHSPELHTSCFV